MRTAVFGRCAFSICVAVGGLADCSGLSRQALAPPAAIRDAGQRLAADAPATSYRLLFSFDFSDGWEPVAGVTVMHGILYGTTYFGGMTCRFGCGTFFSITAAGKERTIHSFKGITQGAHPESNLTLLNGTFYGTTRKGGKTRGGTVFSIVATGTEHVLYNFKGYTDGYDPRGLTVLNGTLYGTTYDGGAHRSGTVFSVTPAGKEHRLHSFKGPDGARPAAALTVFNGTLYGTTERGGDSSCGTVFSMTSAGEVNVLYSFTCGNDGAYPDAALTPLNGKLYGTTDLGGIYDYGTVYSITTAGKERVLYSFKGGRDGAGPGAALTLLNGTFYGTTRQGFRHPRIPCQGYGCGTIFSVTTGGKERVLYTFKGGTDGDTPDSLTALNDTLYGTTEAGGGTSCGIGCGTVFELKP